MTHRTLTLVFASLPLLVACKEETVQLSGRVLEGLDQKAVAAEAGLQVLSPDDGAVLGETRTDADGYFAVDVPMDINVFVRLDDDGARTTTFAGVVSLFDEAIPEGYLYTLPEAEVSELEALFDGCPAGGGPGMVVGEVRHQDVMDGDGVPVVNAGTQVTLYLEGGGTLKACYLDEEGGAYDPAALLTGGSGRFALLGVPAGVHELEVAYDASLSERQVETYPVLVAEKASVSPWFPAWVTLPL
jgi:hypothetical protein